MSTAQFEQENINHRNASEGREVRFESKENKEAQELKKLAAKERAETISKEVRSTKQQIQNIMANMQQVIKAVQAIRAQLQLVDNNEEVIPSVRHDQKRVGELKVRLMDLGSQLDGLKQALVEEEKKRLQAENPVLMGEKLEVEADKIVEEVLKKLKG